MDGGKQPLRDGDWAVMRLARSLPASSVENRVVLVQVSDSSGAQYQIKRLKREGRGWKLTSDNPDGPTFDATESTTPIARLDRVIRPEELAPPIGATMGERDITQRFGFDGVQPRSQRYGGHLFIFVNDKGTLVEPDRLKFVAVEPRPAETAFVLSHRDDGDWQYLGVARQTGERGVWSLPAVDFATWRRWGEGRDVSRRLPEAALSKAQLAADALLALPDDQRWITRSDGRKARVLGRAQRGGLRVAGGDDGFAERTVSLNDLAWVIATDEDVAEHKGILDEQRVNRLRYLEGTPKGSTRWIDTGWAIAAWKLAAPMVRGAVATESFLRRVKNSQGAEIDASFRLERVGESSTIVFESRGGTKGSASERNTEYATGLELLLERLKAAGLRIRDILVESRDTDSLPVADRRVLLRDEPYPVSITDPEGLRKKISAAQALVGRAKGAKGGGNQTKRLRIFVGDTSLAKLAAALESVKQL